MEDDMKRNRNGGIHCLVPAILILVSACAQAPHLRPGYRTLEERVTDYHDAFRWRDYESAVSFIKPDEREGFREYTETIKEKLSVEDYKIVKVSREEKELEAAIVIKRSYTLLPSVTLKEDEFEQHWVFLEDAWYLAGPPF
jgi:hypothetical protein